MTAAPDPRLPKWAQTEWTVMRNRIEALERALAERDGMVERTDTVVIDWDGNTTMPLRAGSTIGFHRDVLTTGDAAGRYPDFRVGIDGNGHLNVNGTSRVVVVPLASNSIEVRIL